MPGKTTNLDNETKKAWEENWQDVSVKDSLEAANYPRVQHNIEIYKSYMSKEGKTLEGGCGLGTYLIHFKNLGYDIVGVDYNAGPLLKISEYDKDIALYCADVRNLPFSDNSFKTYLSIGVIEHFSQGPGMAIDEAYRVLSPGGYFVVHVPQSSIFHKILLPVTILKRNTFLRRLFKKEPKQYYWEHYFKANELAKLLRKSGFKIVRMMPVDQEHSLINFCSLFRDKNSYDGANSLGIAVANFCRAYIPRLTAAGLIIVGRKE